MLNAEGFDRWAKQYDDDTHASDDDNTYPFAGYRQTLHAVAEKVLSADTVHPSVLDIGFGTGIVRGENPWRWILWKNYAAFMQIVLF